MPQIVSLLPTAAALPAAAPATLPTSTAAVAPGTLLPAELTSPNFLAQFKSALKTLANVVVLPQLMPRRATEPTAGPLMSPVSDQAEAPAAAESDKKAEARMPDLLVELGFAVVPPAFPLPEAPRLVATGPGGPATQSVLQSVAEVQVLPSVVPQPTPVLLGDAAAHETLPDAAVTRALPDAKLGKRLSDAPVAQMLADAYAGPSLVPIQTQPATAAPQLSPQPLEHLKPSDQPQSPNPTLTAQPILATAPDLAGAVLQPVAAHQPTAAAPAGTQVPPIALQHQASQGGSQSSTGSNHQGRHTADKVGSIRSEATALQTAPASDAAMVAAAATTTSPAGPVPQQVGPSQVVSQIANHADLIRLPGNKGLHIQLHPDDLGGVQVTVRYSPGGGVELHINAEHAATGALVQAGWTELRDALAGHGISADRLMMSVTSPTAAGQADLPGGGDSRSDPNAYSSNASGTTGQSLGSPDSSSSQGQGRQDNAQERTSQTWRGGVEPVSSPDDTPRAATTTAAASRIDYRV